MEKSHTLCNKKLTEVGRRLKKKEKEIMELELEF
jgi:hypothetical protein